MANAITLPEEFRGLVLSATEVYDLTGWPQAMVEDYLTLVENLLLLSESINGKFVALAILLPKFDFPAPIRPTITI